MAQPLDPAFAATAADSRGLESLKAQARGDPRSAARAAAVKFEALFLQQVLSQMRQSQMPGADLFGSEATKIQTSLYDQQIAEKLAQRGTGLADAITRQIERLLSKREAGAAQAATAPGTAQPVTPSMRRAVGPSPVAAQAAQSAVVAPADRKADFVARVLPQAEAAAKALGVPASFVVGQAALETGWGRREIVGRDGTPSHNLFAIKADARWTGRTVEATTTEVVNGVAHKVVQRFRAYDSYAAAFEDYAKLVGGSPRYAARVRNAPDALAFAQGLKQGGYATDPDYARKLAGTIASAGREATRLAAAAGGPERLA